MRRTNPTMTGIRSATRSRKSTLPAVHVPECRRHQVVAQAFERFLGSVVVLVVRHRDGEPGDFAVDGVLHLPWGGRRREERVAVDLVGKGGHACVHRHPVQRLTVVRPHGDHVGRTLGRERLGHGLVGLDLRNATGQILDARLGQLHSHRGRGEREQRRDAHEERHPGVAQDRPQDSAPEPGIAVAPGEPPQQRNPGTVDPPAEDGEQRGQHRDRADDRDGHDQDRADGERFERHLAGEEHSGHGDDDREPGDHDGAPRRGRSDRHRIERSSSLPPFLTFAADIEQRVVHADGHTDEQDHRGEDVGGGEEVRRERREPHGGGDRRQREHHRDGRGDEGPEHDDQDHQRDGYRQELGALEVVGVQLVERVADRCVADLADDQTGRPDACVVDDSAHIGGGGAGRVRLLLVGALRHIQGHVQQHCCAVLGRHGVLDGGHTRQRRECVVQVGHHRVGGIHRSAGVGPDEHRLGVRLAEVGMAECRLSAGRLADAVVRVVGILGADGTATDDRRRDERDPDEQRGPLVPGAPAGGADHETTTWGRCGCVGRCPGR
jgi:hypothetical protein